METTETSNPQKSPEEILTSISEGTGGKAMDQTFFPSYTERIKAIELLHQLSRNKRNEASNLNKKYHSIFVFYLRGHGYRRTENVLPEVIQKQVKFLFGKGPRLYQEIQSGEGEKRKAVRIPVEVPAIMEWLESWERNSCRSIIYYFSHSGNI